MHLKVKKRLKIATFDYKELKHSDFNVAIKSPLDFANALGYKLERISKSVFLKAKSSNKFIIAICSINKKIDLKKLAELANVNKLEVASRQDLEVLVDYPPNGVTAIGISDNIIIFMDEGLMEFETILTGAGESGVEIELTPRDLAEITSASITNLVL